MAVTVDGETPLGEILLSRADRDHEAELAYAVGARHRRQHLAIRTVEVITDYGLHTLGMTHVLLRIPVENIASSAVAHALGFHLNDAGPTAREGVRYGLLTWRRSK